MSFNCPCLIRKNTSELRKKLEELGLELINNDNCTLDAHNYDGKGNHKTINEGTAIITYLSNHYGIIYDITDAALKNRIDCGTNEQLFLALAALRNDIIEKHNNQISEEINKRNRKSMSFNCPCFIHKNTPELRKKLEELGYKFSPQFDATCDALHTRIGYNYNEPHFVEEHYEDLNNGHPFDGIDCGTNEQLFLALAALRDDTDKNQWFVLDSYYGSINYPYQFLYPEGTFVLCSSDKWEDNIFSVTKAHKATAREIIGHFKNKL